MPQTPLTIPFTHNVIFGKESYSTLIQNEYRRLKGFRQVERGDRVVFGFPDGDTVLRRAPAEDYHTLVRVLGQKTVDGLGEKVVRPMDKKDHYVKRCVALPGDVLEVRDGRVWINGEKEPDYPGLQLSWKVYTNGQRINAKTIEKLGLNATEVYYDPSMPGYPAMILTSETLQAVRGLPNVVKVEDNFERDSESAAAEIFPFSAGYGWTRDYFGPLRIPKKGERVEITPDNLPLYERIISAYEGGNVQEALEKGEYTFRQDYYFMMGDNRHNSLDSRYWGFVPEDHIVGRPVLIWLSTDAGKTFPKNIRWGRFLKFV